MPTAPLFDMMTAPGSCASANENYGAGALAYLANADFVTGQIIVVDGGRSLVWGRGSGWCGVGLHSSGAAAGGGDRDRHLRFVVSQDVDRHINWVKALARADRRGVRASKGGVVAGPACP